MFLSRRSFTFLFALNQLFSSGTYGHPEPCVSDLSIVGFSSIGRLNQWMATVWYFLNQGGRPNPPYTFHLCPNTVFDDDFIFPVLNDTWIVCGKAGSSTDNCIVEGGETQVVILPHDYTSEGAKTPPLEHVNFLGITFTKSTDVSVGAYGGQNSWAFFQDCHWKELSGRFAVHLLPPSKSDTIMMALPSKRRLNGTEDKSGTNNGQDETVDESAMMVQFNECTFEDTISKHSTIVNVGGAVTGTDVQFRRNINKWTNVFDKNGRLTKFEDSVFEANNNYFTVITVGGELHLLDCTFHANVNDETTIHVIDGGKLVMEGTSVRKNTNSIGPGLIDSESTFVLNERNTGYSNSGKGCSGFYILDEDTVCEINGECAALCCEFGDETCDATPDATNSVDLIDSVETPETKEETQTEMQMPEMNLEFPTLPPSTQGLVISGITGMGNEDSSSKKSSSISQYSYVLTLILSIGLVFSL